MADWFWPVVVQGVVTAIAGVLVGWALLRLNRRAQSRDAASVIQHRSDALRIILGDIISAVDEVNASDEVLLDESPVSVFNWIHESETFAAFLEDQQFAIFDQETRAELFYVRELSLEMIALAKEVKSLFPNGWVFDGADVEQGDPGELARKLNFASKSMNHMTEELQGYLANLAELSVYLNKEFGAASYVPNKIVKDADE